jgi:acyl-coenzyme A synthetase/AMP-(fatty) acid ligase
MDVSLPGTLDAGSVAEAVASIDATMVFASPAALENITRTSTSVHPDHVDALANVRLLLSAGAPVRASLLSGMAAVLPNATAHTPYGMTEVLPVASISLPELEAAGSGDGVCVGRPLPGVDVTIEPLSPNTKLGEIVARAAHMRSSYDRLWHTTHLASQPSGWHRTGDVGWLDDDGQLWVCGRLNHVLWTADGPLGPVGLEKAIESIDGVYSAAVVGVGPRGLAQTVAVLQLDDEAGKPGIADLALSDAVRSISDRDVVAVLVAPSLPVDRRHNSKIDRAAVKSWAERALSGGPIGKL